VIQLDLHDWRPDSKQARRGARVHAPTSTRAPEPQRARPVIKYAGGKTKLLPDLLARMPPTFGRYCEPFCGGAALFFRVAPERAVLGDANADLIGMYRALTWDAERVLVELDWFRSQHSKAHYYDQRIRWNTMGATLSDYNRAAVMLYLNRACFNGLWRVNRAGEMNSPWNKEPVVRFDFDNLRAASTALQRAELRAGDYRETLQDAKAGDFVYFDSPYDGTWTGYTSGAFGPEDQRELAATFRALVDRGVYCMLSNSDTPLVRELYAGFRIDRVKCPRAINSNPAKRGAVDEVIVVGGYTPEAT
jgi:DNA adenine methylase